MIYVTVKQSPSYHQMSLEEFLFDPDPRVSFYNSNETNTRTYAVEEVSPALRRSFRYSTESLVVMLRQFNEKYKCLYDADRKSLFQRYYIPKKSGGIRKIDAPSSELDGALRELKSIFEDKFGVLYHTNAFAYIKGRSIFKAIERHTDNDSRWYAKFDLHDFFGSTTLDFLMRMFSMIYPFSELGKVDGGTEELSKALSLAMLDGGLPQGTPISPLLTNIMMIPIDYKLANTLRDFGKQRYVYTRYADDFDISSRFDFNIKTIENLIVLTLMEFGAPFHLNTDKTHYGSRAGRNYILGICVTDQNKMSVGADKKRRLKAMLTSYILDTKNGRLWSIDDIQIMNGLKNYYRQVEPEVIDDIVLRLNEKYKVNVDQLIKSGLRI